MKFDLTKLQQERRAGGKFAQLQKNLSAFTNNPAYRRDLIHWSCHGIGYRTMYYSMQGCLLFFFLDVFKSCFKVDHLHYD